MTTIVKRLIVNADDFGYTKDINKGIIYAHKNGIVKNTTVLTDREAFEDAVFLSKENPGLKTGLHIDLDEFLEIKRPGGIITGFKIKPTAQQIMDKINIQLDKFLNAGLKLSHIDSHHHAHLLPEVLPIVMQKAKELGVPVRFCPGFYKDTETIKKIKCMLNSESIKYPHFINGWYWGNIDEKYDTAELMVHPEFNDPWRESETANCCNPNLIQYLKEQNIEIISFEEI
ncbi:MAG: ChbG/HpnK family deacetylase [Endomicrobia bacterium]|nr:ChbG/HpnK family deacetylase [Endomicrobiia bacterium]